MKITLSGKRWPLARFIERPSRLIVIIAAVVAAVMIAHFADHAYEGHNRSLLRAERTTQTARDVLVEHTARTFEGITRALQAVADLRNAVARGAVRDPDAIHDLLKAIHGGSPVIHALGWFDAKGDLLHSSNQPRPPRVNIADLEQFRVHADDPEFGLFVGAAARSRVDGTWIMAVSRRVNDADGAFAGVIVGLLRLDHFIRFYSTFDLGDERTIVLMRRDGTVIARDPLIELQIGRSMASMAEFQQSIGRPAATLHLRRPLDGSPHILSYGSIPDAPLVVTASMSRADALAHHYQELLEQGLGVTITLLGLFWGAWLLRRQFREREAAEREQALAAAVVHTSADAIAYRDLGGMIRTWNEGAARLFGFSDSEIVGQSYLRLVPDDRMWEARQFEAALQRGERITGFETVRRRKDGSLVDVSMTMSPVVDRVGAVIGISTIARDISERRHAEQALGEAQRVFKAITANIPGVVYRRIQTPDGRLTIPYFSEGLRDLTGIAPEEGTADPMVVRASVVPEDVTGLDRSFEESAEHGRPWAHEWRVRHRDGTERWARGLANAPRRLPNGDMVWDVVVMDATALKRAEEALKASETRAARAHDLLRDAIDSVSDSFVVYDASDRLVMINQAARNVHPLFAEKAVPGAHIREIVGAAFDVGLIGEPGEDRETVVNRRLAFHRQSSGKTLERRIGDRWFQVREHPTQDGGLVIVRTDVTELKRHEEALRQSEERYRELYNHTPAMMHSIDRDGCLVSVSEYWLACMGYSRDEVLGRHSTEFLTPESQKYAREVVLPEFFRTGVCKDVPYRFKKKDGSVIDVLLSAIAERDAKGDIIRSLAVLVDVTEQKKVEIALKASEMRANEATARLKDAIESLSEGFLLWDADDRLVLFNQAAQRIHSNRGAHLVPGVRFEDMMSAGVRSGKIWQARGREDDYIRERLALHQNPNGEPVEQQFADGRWIAVREHRTREGGVVSIRTDITEVKAREAELVKARAEAEQARARLVDAIESLEDGFLLWGPDDRLILSNSAVGKTNADPQAVPMRGESYRELLKRRLRGGYIAEAKGREAAFLAESLARRRNPPAEPWEREYAPGQWVSIRQRRTRDGGMVVIRTDVTERKRREAELVAARAEADAANHAKSEFLSRMSHELRTPLNAIIGFAQILELDRPRTLTPDQHEFARFISSGGQHLLALVNEVLDFARIEAGAMKLSVERVSVAVSLDDVRHTMAPMAEKAGVTLEVASSEGLPDVRADELRLRQVLINLVSNAIKYNRPGGSVRLSVAANRRRVRFDIADSGVGIAHEHHSALFRPFERLGAEHTHVEGTGIGLAICKRLVEAMRGSIGFMSELGKGSTFWIELPAETGVVAADAPEVAEAALAAAAPRAAAGGYTLLYVEDNPANLRLMEHLMSTLPGVAMLSAPTPQLGLDLAAAHRPDVIVLDLNLPGMSGYEMLAKLKGMPELRNVPIMALTAAALPKDIDRGLAAGFFRYLTKPIDVKLFLSAVDDALAQTPRWTAAAS